MEFRENLRFVLDSKGVLIKELSAKTKISENTIKTYLKENGAEPTLNKALKIAKVLNVSLDFLATGIEDSKKNFKNPIIKKPVGNSKIAEIESLLSKCSKKQLNLILALEKEFVEEK